MGEILDFEKEKNELIARIAFQQWSRKFNEQFSSETSISDLSNEIVGFFVSGSKEAMQLLQDFVLQTLNFKKTNISLAELSKNSRLRIIDVSIFLLDQLRFEAMYRLGWVEFFESREVPLIKLILNFEEKFSHLQQFTPSLSPSHPRYEEYLAVYDSDKKSFIRKLVPDLINYFS